MSSKKKKNLKSMLEEYSFPVLFIMMRNDMSSLTPGRKMAQASHASNAMVRQVRERGSKKVNALLDKWENETEQAFGTCIVLELPTAGFESFEEHYSYISSCMKAEDPNIEEFVGSTVLDPDYVIKDGDVKHSVKMITCGYFFFDKNNASLHQYIKDYNLHP